MTLALKVQAFKKIFFIDVVLQLVKGKVLAFLVLTVHLVSMT